MDTLSQLTGLGGASMKGSLESNRNNSLCLKEETQFGFSTPVPCGAEEAGQCHGYKRDTKLLPLSVPAALK